MIQIDARHNCGTCLFCVARRHDQWFRLLTARLISAAREEHLSRIAFRLALQLLNHICAMDTRDEADQVAGMSAALWLLQEAARLLESTREYRLCAREQFRSYVESAWNPHIVPLREYIEKRGARVIQPRLWPSFA